MDDRYANDKAYIGYPGFRKDKKLKQRIDNGDANTVAEPATLAFIKGLMGEAPDQQGFSVLLPNAEGVRAGGEAGFSIGTALGLAPAAGAVAASKTAKEMARSGIEQYMQKSGLMQNAVEPGLKSTGVFDLTDPLRSPSVLQKPVPRYEPPRGMPRRVQNLMRNKGAFNRAADWTADGMTENGLGWYNMEPLRAKFIEQLGPEQGAASFNQYIDLMAATSAGAKTDSNARIASYYYVNGGNGPVPIPPIGSGYGHKAQNLHNANANQILSGGGLDPIQHPKRFSFAENLKGNQEPVTVDKHNIRMWGMASKDPEWVAQKLEDPKGAGAPDWWSDSKFGPWTPEGFSPRQFVLDNKVKWGDIPPTWFESAPTKTEYGALESLNKKLAKKFGTTPAATQAASWLGAGPTTGLGSPPMSMMNTFDQMLAKRAAARGQTPEEVLKEFITKVRPLSVTGAATGLGYGLLGEAGGPAD